MTALQMGYLTGRREVAYANTEACLLFTRSRGAVLPYGYFGPYVPSDWVPVGCCRRLDTTYPAHRLRLLDTARLRSRTADEIRHAGDPACAGAALSKPARPELRAGLPLQRRLLRPDRRALRARHSESRPGAVPERLDLQLAFLRQDPIAARARPENGPLT